MEGPRLEGAAGQGRCADRSAAGMVLRQGGVDDEFGKAAWSGGRVSLDPRSGGCWRLLTVSMTSNRFLVLPGH